LTSGAAAAQSPGCGFEYAAPRVVVLEPGHDAWVVGDEPAVLIQFDAEEETARRFGLPEEHRHPGP
jgi:streptogramin lyase